jgi:hypothetical protein
MGAVDVKLTQEHELTLEWESSASHDMIADSTLALITGIDQSPASVKRICRPSTLFQLNQVVSSYHADTRSFASACRCRGRKLRGDTNTTTSHVP